MTKFHLHRLTDVLCGGNLRVFSKAQVIAALIGGAIGAFYRRAGILPRLAGLIPAEHDM